MDTSALSYEKVLKSFWEGVGEYEKYKEDNNYIVGCG